MLRATRHLISLAVLGTCCQGILMTGDSDQTGIARMRWMTSKPLGPQGHFSLGLAPSSHHRPKGQRPVQETTKNHWENLYKSIYIISHWMPINLTLKKQFAVSTVLAVLEPGKFRCTWDPKYCTNSKGFDPNRSDPKTSPPSGLGQLPSRLPCAPVLSWGWARVCFLNKWVLVSLTLSTKRIMWCRSNSVDYAILCDEMKIDSAWPVLEDWFLWFLLST